MAKPKPKVVYRITDNPVDDRFPFALISPDGTIVRIGERPRWLADYAFDRLHADEVQHDEDLIKAESRFSRRGDT